MSKVMNLQQRQQQANLVRWNVTSADWCSGFRGTTCFRYNHLCGLLWFTTFHPGLDSNIHEASNPQQDSRAARCSVYLLLKEELLLFKPVPASHVGATFTDHPSEPITSLWLCPDAPPTCELMKVQLAAGLFRPLNVFSCIVFLGLQEVATSLQHTAPLQESSLSKLQKHSLWSCCLWVFSF